ncbi:MAG TPA: hypothetical protein VI454_02260 [Verrucomicrobiae bacterium]|jgi:hypothetical protein
MIIDSQVRAYEANTPARPWASVPNWPPHVTGDEMVAAMDKVGIDGPMPAYRASALSTASGSLAMTASNTRAARSGRRRPCSHA